MARTHIFPPKTQVRPIVRLFYFFSPYYQNYVILCLLYNLTNPIFQHFSLTSAATTILPSPSPVVLFLPISLFQSWRHASVSFSLHHATISLSLSCYFNTLLHRYLFYFLFFIFCVCYFAWCLVFGC